MFAHKRGLFVILSVGLRQTPQVENNQKYRAFLCVYILGLKVQRSNRKAASE